MKRSFIILLISAVTLLSACGKPSPTLPELYESEISVTGGGLDVKGLIRLDADSFRFTVTSPDTAAGLTYTYDKGGLCVSRGELARLSDDGLGAGALPELLKSAITAIPNAEYLDSDEGGDNFSVPSENAKAVLTSKDGEPLKLTFENSPYIVTFYDSKSE